MVNEHYITLIFNVHLIPVIKEDRKKKNKWADKIGILNYAFGLIFMFYIYIILKLNEPLP